MNTDRALLLSPGGTRLRCPCPLTDEHDAVFDLADGLVTCAYCEWVAGRAAYRGLMKNRLERVRLGDRLAELEAAWDSRDWRARQRAARLEEEYVAGLTAIDGSAVAA